MMEYELVQYTNPDGSISHRVKTKDKKTKKEILFRSIIEIPIDDPLCEIIEEFGIPIVRIPGMNYKIRYVSTAEICKKLGMKSNKLDYPQRIITWIHPRESITKKDYKAQVQILTHLGFRNTGRPLTLISLGDAIQILGLLQNDKEKGILVRKLIIKIEELQKKLNKQQKEEIENLQSLLKQLDDICYDWIKEHGENNWYGYKRLWDNQLWQMIIDIYIRIRIILDLPIPKRRNIGLHHPDKYKPYRNIYPHVATFGKIIDKRWDHNDPRQKKYYDD